MPEDDIFYDSFRKRRKIAESARMRRMGSVDFSLPVDGDLPALRTCRGTAGTAIAKIAEEMLRSIEPFMDEVRANWKEMFPDLPAWPGKWIPAAGARPGRLFIHVRSAPALFAMKPKLPAVKKRLAALSSAPARFSVHLEIALPHQA